MIVYIAFNILMTNLPFLSSFCIITIIINCQFTPLKLETSCASAHNYSLRWTNHTISKIDQPHNLKDGVFEMRLVLV